MPHTTIPKDSCEDQFRVVEPQINAEGVHVWPFDPSLPLDVRFFATARSQNVRMNRHDYFELIYLCAGSANLKVQNRTLTLREGDLAVMGSTLYHNVECRSVPPLTLAVLFFQPDLIRSDGGADSAEYLLPFLFQDSDFPHIISAKTGVPSQAFDFMQRIRTELPATSVRARLAAKTYLKMILILLVNQYSSYAGTVEIFERQQRALDRLRPLFDFVDRHYGDSIQVNDASRICGMSESHFMNFFKRTTGRSFLAYLNHYRIERAQALLAISDKSVTDISQEMGFCDQSYFGTVFRKIVGMSPATYRRCYRADSMPGSLLVDHSFAHPAALTHRKNGY